SADIDIPNSANVGARRVPQVAELFDAGVVHQQPYRADVTVGAIGESLDGRRVANVAHHLYRRTACGAELLAQLRYRVAIDVGDNHRHAQPAGVPRPSRTDPGAGAGDAGDSAGERIHA